MNQRQSSLSPRLLPVGFSRMEHISSVCAGRHTPGHLHTSQKGFVKEISDFSYVNVSTSINTGQVYSKSSLND